MIAARDRVPSAEFLCAFLFPISFGASLWPLRNQGQEFWNVFRIINFKKCRGSQRVRGGEPNGVTPVLLGIP